MYVFLLNMWVAERVSKEKLYNAVKNGHITEAEYNLIIATPQGI